MARKTVAGANGGDVDITARIETAFEGGSPGDVGSFNRFGDIASEFDDLPVFGRQQSAGASYFGDIASDFDRSTYALTFQSPSAASARMGFLEVPQASLSPYLPVLSYGGGGLVPPAPPPSVYSPGGDGNGWDGGNNPLGFPLPPPPMQSEYATGPAIDSDFSDDPTDIPDIDGKARSERVRPYKERQRRRREIRESLEDQWTENYGFASTETREFKSAVRNRWAGEDLADNERPTDLFRSRMRQASEDFEDQWISEGNTTLGGSRFQKARQEYLIDQGLAEKETLLGRLREDKVGLGFGFGFAAMTAGSGVSQYVEKTESGQYVSPEQQAASAANAWMPAAGMAVGTLAGAFGPAFGLAGQFAGGAVGQIGASIFGAQEEREQTTRETAERLANVLNDAAESVDRFKVAIEATGAPVQQLSQGLTVLQDMAPGVGVRSVEGAGRSALSQGATFVEDTKAVGSFLGSDAALYSVYGDYARTGGEIGSGALLGAADIALSRGDVSAYNAARRQATTSGLNSDPEYQGLAKRAADAESNKFYEAQHFAVEHLGGVLGWISPGVSTDPIQEADRARNDYRRKQLAGAETQSGQDIADSLDYGKARLGTISAGVESDLASGAYAEAQLSGASGDTLAGYLPRLRGAADSRIAADDLLIQKAGERIKRLNPNDPNQQQEIIDNNLDISRLRSDEQASRNSVLQTTRSVFDAQINDRSGRIQQAIAQDYYAGGSAREMEGDYRAQIGLENYLATGDTPLSPGERSQHAVAAATAAYKLGETVFAQDVQSLDTQGSALASRLGDTQRTGTFADVARAELSTATNDLAKQARIEQRLREPGVPFEEVNRLTAESNQLGEEAAGITYRAGIDRYEGERGEIQYKISDPGLNRRLRLQGNAGMTADDLSSVGDLITLDRGEIARNTDPKRRAMLDDRLQGDEAEMDDRTEISRRYRPSARDSSRIIESETDFEVARLSPWQAGPESNPWQRGMALENVYQGQIASRNANRDRLKAANKWDDIDEQNYQQDSRGDRLRLAGLQHEQMYAEFEAVPEMIAGSPGGGIGAAVINPAAVSAWFNPSPVAGGFGRTPGSTQSIAPSPQSGFMGAAASDHNSSQMVGLLQQIVMLMARGGGINAGGHPGQDATGVANMFLGKTFDPLMPR